MQPLRRINWWTLRWTPAGKILPSNYHDLLILHQLTAGRHTLLQSRNQTLSQQPARSNVYACESACACECALMSLYTTLADSLCLANWIMSTEHDCEQQNFPVSATLWCKTDDGILQTHYFFSDRGVIFDLFACHSFGVSLSVSQTEMSTLSQWKNKNKLQPTFTSKGHLRSNLTINV